MSSVTLVSNWLGKKGVDGVDLIFEFPMVGQNFGAQEENPDCPRYYKLQCQKGHVVLVAENGTALADRREPSDVYVFSSFEWRLQWKTEIWWFSMVQTRDVEVFVFADVEEVWANITRLVGQHEMVSHEQIYRSNSFEF